MQSAIVKLPLVVNLRYLIEQGIVGSRRTMFRQIAAKKFPTPDGTVGKRLAWKRATILGHLEKEGLA